MNRTRTYLHPAVSIALAVAWMAFIFYMSAKVAADSDAISDGLIDRVLMLTFGSIDSDLARSMSHPVRKLAHFTEYTVLGVLLLNVVRSVKLHKGSGMGAQPGLQPLRFAHAAGAWALGTLYAASDEFHQLFVPGRSGQISDVCIDASGVLLGVILCFLAIYLVRRKD